MTPLLDELEPRRLMAVTGAGVYGFGGKGVAAVEDADGTVARFALTAGRGEVTVGEDGSWRVAVSQASAGSVLTVTTGGGNGRVAVAELTAGTVGTFNAAGAQLSGVVSFDSVRVVTLGKVTDLSLSSGKPIGSLSAVAWGEGDGVANVVAAPSIGTLKVAGNFAAGLSLSAQKVALGSATVGGVVSGVWGVAGSVGTLKVKAVRSPDLTIGGSVGSLVLDDFVAVSQVKSATGGVLHIGGKGSVSAGKGADTFQVAKNSTLYTCTAEMYTWAELYGYTNGGRRWVYSDNGKKETTTASGPVKSGGRNLYTVSNSGGGSEQYYVDAQGRGHLLGYTDALGSFRVNDLALSPGAFRLGGVFQSSSKASMSMYEDGVSANLAGAMAYSTRLVGHELVKTPAGTFLAAKFASSVSGGFSGAATNGVESIGLKVSMSGKVVEHLVPGVGLVKEDNFITGKMSAPSLNRSETNSDVNRHVLLKMPVDLS